MHDGILKHHIITQPPAHVLPVPFGELEQIIEKSVVLAVCRGHEQPHLGQHGLVREPGLDRPDGDRGCHPAVAVDDAGDPALTGAHSGYGFSDLCRIYRQPKVVGLIGG